MAIPAPVNGQITDAVTQANVKVLGDAPAMAMISACGTIIYLTSIATSSPRESPVLGRTRIAAVKARASSRDQIAVASY
jgi:hypothetical protein